ncbi:MAG: AlwI family type II restriction endonuclease [Candidatus Bathyarchaeia archaeon]
MSACQTIRKNIKDVDSFIASFRHEEQSARVELLFSKALSYMFHLPFYTFPTNNPYVQHKVVWYGEKEMCPIGAPANYPDAIVYARHFDVLMEVTRNTGTRQWDREYARTVRHFQDYIKKWKKERDSVFLLLIVNDINRDTFTSVQAKNREGYNILPITFQNFERILEVCDLAVGLRHFDLRILFSRLIRNLIDSQSLTAYNKCAKRSVLDWRVTLLDRYRLAYVAVKGYQVFVTENRQHLGASEIATEIYTERDVKNYFKILGKTPQKEDVIDGMLTFGFASDAGLPQTDMILSLVSPLEIRERIKEIMETID